MRFIIDESTGKRLAILLEKDGHDVLFVGDILPSESDEKILQESKKQNRVLITDDKDFGELIFRIGRPSSGVILLRTFTLKPEIRLRILRKVFEIHDPKNKFTVVKEYSIRTRKL